MSRTRHLKLSLKLALLLCSSDDHASYLPQKLSLLKHVQGLTRSSMSGSSKEVLVTLPIDSPNGKPQPVEYRYEESTSAELGSGCFATVFVAQRVTANVDEDRAPAKIALKRINKKELEEKGHNTAATVIRVRNALENEIRIHRELSRSYNANSKAPGHDNIVKMFGATDPCDNREEYREYLYIAMEYIGGWALHDYIDCYVKTEQQQRDVFTQIMTGVSYMHSLGIYHCDLKPENILVTCDHKVKIIDFGLAVEYVFPDENEFLTREAEVQEEAEVAPTICKGTPGFVPPEMIVCSGGDDIKAYYWDFCPLDPKIDVFACGVIFYEILFRRQSPFFSSSEASAVNDKEKLIKKKFEWTKTREPDYRRLVTVKLVPSISQTISCESEHLLRGMLEKNSKKRMCVKTILNHKWMKNEKFWRTTIASWMRRLLSNCNCYS